MKNTIKLTFTFADGRVETQVLDKPDGAPVRVAVPSGAKVDVEVLSPESDGAKSESAADAQAIASEHAIQFTKVGQDLVVEDAGEQLLELVDFYATPDVTMGSVWWDYAELLSQATSSEMVASEAMQASASTGAGEAAAVVEGGAAGFSPALFAGLGALGLGGGGGTAAVSNVVSGLFVAGPAVTGHSLEVSLFDTNGTLLGGPTKLGADGSFSFDVGSYTGRVIAQLVDTDDTTSDYFDEATGAPIDLTTPMLAIGTTAEGATTLNINVLTTMAAKQAGVVASSGIHRNRFSGRTDGCSGRDDDGEFDRLLYLERPLVAAGDANPHDPEPTRQLACCIGGLGKSLPTGDRPPWRPKAVVAEQHWGQLHHQGFGLRVSRRRGRLADPRPSNQTR